MMRVFYGQAKGNAHRYQCRGDDAHVGAGLCNGIGGVRVDRAVALDSLAVSDTWIEIRCCRWRRRANPGVINPVIGRGSLLKAFPAMIGRRSAGKPATFHNVRNIPK